uniref:Uncharacterized protein n=1 Tax=Cacopsylla melanoneura TaxID=428564 RepID=A0A8D8XH64_9HEMI
MGNLFSLLCGGASVDDRAEVKIKFSLQRWKWKVRKKKKKDMEVEEKKVMKEEEENKEKEGRRESFPEVDGKALVILRSKPICVDEVEVSEGSCVLFYVFVTSTLRRDVLGP